MFELKVAFSLVVFCSHAAFHFDFYRFFDFLDRIFFLNGFRNPFNLIYFWPIFCVRTKLLFLASGFYFSCGLLTLFFRFLSIF